MRNATATPLDQVGRSQLADGLVIDSDETGLHSSDGAIDQNERNLPLLHVAKALAPGLRRGQNQPVHLPGQQRLGFVSLQLGVFLEIRNDDVIAMRSDCLGYCFGDFREKRMGEVGQQQSNGKGAPGYQTAGDPVGLIVQGLGPAQDSPRVAALISPLLRRTLETVTTETPTSFAMSCMVTAMVGKDITYCRIDTSWMWARAFPT